MQSVKLNAAQARQQLPDDATLRHQIMERLIMDQIILQMGQKMGVKISDEQLDQAIANIAKQNNMTLDQMRSRLAYDGLNYNTYRNQIRKEMLSLKCVTTRCVVASPSCRRKSNPWRSKWVTKTTPALS